MWTGLHGGVGGVGPSENWVTRGEVWNFLLERGDEPEKGGGVDVEMGWGGGGEGCGCHFFITLQFNYIYCVCVRGQ